MSLADNGRWEVGDDPTKCPWWNDLAPEVQAGALTSYLARRAAIGQGWHHARWQRPGMDGRTALEAIERRERLADIELTAELWDTLIERAEHRAR